MERIHPKLYVLESGHNKVCHILAKSWLIDTTEDIVKCQKSLCLTHPLMLMIICACNETRTTRTPAFWDIPPTSTHPHPTTPTTTRRHPMITHTSDSHEIPSQVKQDKIKVTNEKHAKNPILKCCKKLYMRHTFSSCLIRCTHMKWIQPEL